jgi:hypothetical protein
VDVTIGIQNTPREVAIEVSATTEEVMAAVAKALSDGGVLDLVDDKGRRLVVPGSALAYVDIGEPTERRVGFGAS